MAVYAASLHAFTFIASAATMAPVVSVAASAGWPVTYSTADTALLVDPDVKTRAGLRLWPAQIKHDLFQTGLEAYWNNTDKVRAMSAEQWSLIIKQDVTARETARWFRSMQSKVMLKQYRSYKTALVLEPFLSVPHGGWNDQRLKGRRLCTQLRSGMHMLAVNTGRWQHIDRQDRICRLCHNGVEDEKHFLMTCSFLQQQHEQLWHCINAKMSAARDTKLWKGVPLVFDALSLSADDQWKLLTGGMLSIIEKSGLVMEVRSLIMVHTAKWMDSRSEHIEAMDEFLRKASLQV